MAPPEESRGHYEAARREANVDGGAAEAADTVKEPPPTRRPRTMTTTEEIDSTITRPGSVKINVTGAFIVDPDTATPAVGNGYNGATPAVTANGGRISPTHHETSDIRLPNHTAVVSHIAIDVSLPPTDL
jgi:type II pantothenate kinase